MSGPALAGQITAMKPGIRVLYMSGQSTDLLSDRVAAGRGKFIQKPFTPQALLDKVDSVLGAPAPPV